jgi:hypothetical protein
MILREINTSQHDKIEVIPLVEQYCTGEGLVQTMKGTLASYPGCTHWHYKRDLKQPGVLEITYWPAQDRLWLSAHRNRFAGWISAAATALATNLETELRPIF